MQDKWVWFVVGIGVGYWIVPRVKAATMARVA
jgi:hypothetical protein